MATVTSKASGDWSDGSTWDSDPAIPVDNDTVIVDAAHTVSNFNVDMSGWANGIDLTVNGTLSSATGAGTYHLLCSDDIDGTGTIFAGSSGTALPFTAKFTIDLNGANKFDGLGGLTVNLYDTEPTNTYINLSGVEAIGQTELSVDTDVTADIWAVGDTVRIDDINYGIDTEESTIAAGGIAAGAITIDDVLAAQKESGAYLVLCTRNIKITGGTGYAAEDLEDSYIRCELDGTSGFQRAENLEFAGVARGLVYVFVSGGNNIMSGHCTGTNTCAALESSFLGSGIVTGTFFYINTMSGASITGSAYGCFQCVDACSSINLTGAIFKYSTIGINVSSDIIAGNCVFQNTSDITSEMNRGSFYNCSFLGTTEFTNYNTNRPKNAYCESSNHDQIVNAFKAWPRGGIVTSQTASPPTGFTIYYRHANESVDYPAFREAQFTLQPDEAITINAQCRLENGKDYSGYAPRIQIVDYFADPLVDASQSYIDEDIVGTTMGDGATWQALSVSAVNTGDSPKTYKWRVTAKHATGYFDEVISLPDYKTQIQAIYDNIGTAVALDGGDATIAGMLTKLADDNDGADFSAARESLYALRNRGDLAWTTGVGSPAQNVYTIDSITRTVGDNDGGDDTMVDVVDGSTFDTGEVAATTKLEVDAVFTATDPMEDPAYVAIWGYYAAGGAHHMIVKAYNYIDSTFEEVGQIGIGTEVSFYSYPLNPQHIKAADGEISIKIVHSEHSGVTSHVLYIDKIIVATAEASALHANIDDILEDTNEIQGKLPDDNIMGSSTTESMDDEINAIKANLGQVHTVEDESPGGGGGAATTSGIAEGC